MNKYKCAICNKHFSFPNDFDFNVAKEKYNILFKNLDFNNAETICEDCFHKFKKWYDSLTEKEFNTIYNKAKIKDILSILDKNNDQNNFIEK